MKLETEHGVEVYDIEFVAKGMEYDFYINAKTGEILEFDSERID